MKLMIASDIHGAAGYCRALLDAFDRERADRLLLLGDILYHGPRNDLPDEYAPKQVLAMLADCGALSDILASGARLLECACGPCIGMGFSPNSGGVSLRTFNRNFLGRSGTRDGQVYLVSPETAVASALTGYITAPKEV